MQAVRLKYGILRMQHKRGSFRHVVIAMCRLISREVCLIRSLGTHFVFLHYPVLVKRIFQAEDFNAINTMFVPYLFNHFPDATIAIPLYSSRVPIMSYFYL